MTPDAAAWTDLGGGVLVRRSVEYLMNSMLLLDAEETVVVDAGVLPSELDDIAAAAGRAAPKRVTLFFSHAHWDHVLARPWFPGAKTLAHDRCGGELKRDREKILREAEKAAERHGERWTRGFEPFRPDETVSGLRFVRLGPWRLVFRDAFGHSDCQLSLHLPDRRILFAADMLSDVEIPILDRECAAFRLTLETLLPLARHGAIETLVPGHGTIARGRDPVIERLERDLGYLRALERGARECAREGLDADAARQRLAGAAWGGAAVPEDMKPVHAENVGFALAGVLGETKRSRTNTRENGSGNSKS